MLSKGYIGFPDILTLPTESAALSPIAAINPSRPAAASGLVHASLEGQDEDGDDEDEISDKKVGADLKFGSSSSQGKPCVPCVNAYLKLSTTRQKEEEKEQ